MKKWLDCAATMPMSLELSVKTTSWCCFFSESKPIKVIVSRPAGPCGNAGDSNIHRLGACTEDPMGLRAKGMTMPHLCIERELGMNTADESQATTLTKISYERKQQWRKQQLTVDINGSSKRGCKTKKQRNRVTKKQTDRRTDVFVFAASLSRSGCHSSSLPALLVDAVDYMVCREPQGCDDSFWKRRHGAIDSMWWQNLRLWDSFLHFLKGWYWCFEAAWTCLPEDKCLDRSCNPCSHGDLFV